MAKPACHEARAFCVNMTGSSRLPGFYNLPLAGRLEVVADEANLTAEEVAVMSGKNGLSSDAADHMVENAVGVFGLPLGIATNFLVNGRDVLVPMAIEEPSVVAGASFAARLIREGGGFTATSDEPVMIAQVQILDLVKI